MPSLASSGIEIRWAMQALQNAVAGGIAEILVAGPRGTGKTIFISYFLHDLCLRYPGMTQVWVRSNRTRLTDAVLRTFEEEVLGVGHPLISGQQRENRHRYNYPNGSKIILQGLDDPERQRSVGADIVWVNEPTEISEDEWEEVGASLRATLGTTCPFRLKLGDHNPAPPSHWTNQRCKPLPQHLYPRVLDDGLAMGKWFTPDMYRQVQEYNFSDQSAFKTFRIQTFHADNPDYWDVNAWGWKPNGREYVQNRLGKMGGPRKARYLEGRPAAAEGVVFIEFDNERHVVPAFTIPSTWPLHLAEDPGYDHPTAICVVAVAPNGRKYIVAEYVERQTTVEQDAKWLTDVEREQPGIIRAKLGDPHYMFHETKHNSGETIAQQMAKFGHKFTPAPAATNTADLNAQVESVRTGLITDLTDGDPEIQVFDTCPKMSNAFQSWSYKRNTKGEVTGGEDKYEEPYKDEMDAVRMIVASKPTYNNAVCEVYSGE